MTDASTKYCRLCGTDKSVSEFYKNRSASDGLVAYCKPCWKAYRKGYNAEYQQSSCKHAEYRRGYEADRYSNDPEYRDRKLASNSAWRERNPEAWQESLRWNGTRQAYHDQRRLIIESSVDVIDRRVIWGRDEGRCRVKLVCNGVFVSFEEMHLDHVIPLARGGTHTWNNVQTSCAPCNLAKGAQILERV